jgi:hypothetical protein
MSRQSGVGQPSFAGSGVSDQFSGWPALRELAMGKNRAKPLLTDNDVMKLLRTAIATTGSQRAWAMASGVDRPVINGILKGTRGFQPKVLLALGLKRVNAYSRFRSKAPSRAPNKKAASRRSSAFRIC